MRSATLALTVQLYQSKQLPTGVRSYIHSSMPDIIKTYGGGIVKYLLVRVYDEGEDVKQIADKLPSALQQKFLDKVQYVPTDFSNSLATTLIDMTETMLEKIKRATSGRKYFVLSRDLGNSGYGLVQQAELLLGLYLTFNNVLMKTEDKEQKNHLGTIKKQLDFAQMRLQQAFCDVIARYIAEQKLDYTTVETYLFPIVKQPLLQQIEQKNISQAHDDSEKSHANTTSVVPLASDGPSNQTGSATDAAESDSEIKIIKHFVSQYIMHEGKLPLADYYEALDKVLPEYLISILMLLPEDISADLGSRFAAILYGATTNNFADILYKLETLYGKDLDLPALRQLLLYFYDNDFMQKSTDLTDFDGIRKIFYANIDHKLIILALEDIYLNQKTSDTACQGYPEYVKKQAEVYLSLNPRDVSSEIAYEFAKFLQCRSHEVDRNRQSVVIDGLNNFAKEVRVSVLILVFALYVEERLPEKPHYFVKTHLNRLVENFSDEVVQELIRRVYQENADHAAIVASMPDALCTILTDKVKLVPQNYNKALAVKLIAIAEDAQKSSGLFTESAIKSIKHYAGEDSTKAVHAELLLGLYMLAHQIFPGLVGKRDLAEIKGRLSQVQVSLQKTFHEVIVQYVLDGHIDEAIARGYLFPLARNGVMKKIQQRRVEMQQAVSADVQSQVSSASEETSTVGASQETNEAGEESAKKVESVQAEDPVQAGESVQAEDPVQAEKSVRKESESADEQQPHDGPKAPVNSQVPQQPTGDITEKNQDAVRKEELRSGGSPVSTVFAAPQEPDRKSAGLATSPQPTSGPQSANLDDYCARVKAAATVREGMDAAKPVRTIDLDALFAQVKEDVAAKQRRQHSPSQ